MSKRRVDPGDILPVVGGGIVKPGPFTEWPDEIEGPGDVPIHYGPNWPEDPFDWRFGCSMVPIDPERE